jgi:ubiquinone/menaquinone biosynthesis C-methylase UbiE
MIEGRFNTDTPALARRIQAHERFGARDLGTWVLEHAALAEGHAVLDLGCGTGKQSVPAAGLVGPTGRVASVDLSQEALDTLRRAADAAGVGDRVETFRCGLDEADAVLGERAFDRVLSCYALYYVQDARALFQALLRRLRPEGTLFFCGPARANNRELKEFHHRLHGGEPAGIAAAEFMEGEGQALARELFARVEVSTFENPLRFDSPEALYGYWSSYNLYDPALDGAFRAAAEAHFAQAEVFETVKRVIGVRAFR